MSFNQEKFEQLSSINRLKKIAYHLRDSLLHRKPEIQNNLYKDMIHWVNSMEYRQFSIPQTQQEKESLYYKVMQIIQEEDPYAETTLFDKEAEERSIFNIHLILDNIRSPFNVGSLFRTSESLGVQSLILLGITPTPDQNSKIMRTAKHSLIPYTYCPNYDHLETHLKANKTLIAIEKTNQSTDILDFRHYPIAKDHHYYFILGNEEFGINRVLLDKCLLTYHIPLKGRKNSLNVSVAAGIALYYISQRFTY